MNTQPTIKPWPALWSLVIGFFMILVDTTIVSVANPAIMRGLNADMNSVIWVTSAYLLAYAVPLLITGRLGDRFGPKRVYLVGLTVFTLSSLWCGLSGSIDHLIMARVAQGLGAAMMTPQTMAVITRIFPPNKRGSAMALWGATAGVATLVGPILGGVLVDGLGWEWIFFINVPVGVIGFFMAMRFVPTLQTNSHSFDFVGVVLSAVGLFLLVFGIQEGESFNWGTIVGPISVWGLIIAGAVVLALFIVWQAVMKGEPLLPLGLFRERNFSVGNMVISVVGFTVVCMSLPLMFYLQTVRGLTPTQAALMTAPMAVISALMAPFIGKAIDRMNPKWFALVGLTSLSGAMFWYSTLLTVDQPIWMLLIPSCLMGIANGCMWGPVSNLATRNLPPQSAGAGSGVFNTTRQIGSVLGSASIAALIQSRLVANLPQTPGGGSGATEFGTGTLPEPLHEGFATAMSQTLLLPAAVALLGAVFVLFFQKPRENAWTKPKTVTGGAATQQTEA